MSKSPLLRAQAMMFVVLDEREYSTQDGFGLAADPDTCTSS